MADHYGEVICYYTESGGARSCAHWKDKSRMLCVDCLENPFPDKYHIPISRVLVTNRIESQPKIILTKRDESLMVHYMMLTRQLTHLADCLFHIVRLKTQKDGTHGSAHLDYRGYRVYAQSEIADMLVQTKRILDFIDTYSMGLKRDIEKKKYYLETHPDDEWV